MARRVFFSFHYEGDVWRASQVRQSWVTKPNRETAGFWDHAEWESVKRSGRAAVERWIDRQLEGSSVTVVLIGAETADREYVQYEIARSHERGNGILGVYVDGCADRTGRTCARGANPFDRLSVPNGHGRTALSQLYPTYDWVTQRGYDNLGTWVERAAVAAGR